MAGSDRSQRAIIATIAVLVLATACGRVAAPGADSVAQVTRDPDNPYFAGYIPTSTSPAAGIVRDPDNPYWFDNPYLTGAAAVTTSTASVIRDPDNPYWTGR